MERVLVTGGTGYVATFCIAQLLNEGVDVRTTVRDLDRADALRETLGRLAPGGARLSVLGADLERDAGWSEAVEGCDGVLHVASPLPTVNPRDDDVLIRPARDGALRVLTAARDAGVHRVVMTSSTAAVAYGRGSSSRPLTEADWSDPADRSDSSAYERSKMLAERAAWDWHGAEGGALELSTICPGAVIGPVASRDFSASIEIIRKLLDRSLPGLPRFGFPLVDVRDIADLHVRALRSPAAPGQRYLGAGPFLWMAEIAAILRAEVPELAGRVPGREMPSWLVRLASVFDGTVRGRLFELDKARPVSADKAQRELGWTPRPVAETIVDTARSLAAEGIV